MDAVKRSVWQVAADLRGILDGLDLERLYPDVRTFCFVGLRSVQLEVQAPTARQRLQVVRAVVRNLEERYAGWERFYEVHTEDDSEVIIIGGEHLMETL